MAEQSPRERDVVEHHLGRAWRSFTPDASLQDRVRARLTSSTAATLALGTGAALKVRPEGTWASLQTSSKLGTALVGAGLLGMGLLSGYLLRDARDEPPPPARLTPSTLGAPAAALPAASPPDLMLESSAPAAPVREAPAAARVLRAAPPMQPRARSAAPPSEAPSATLETAEPHQELALLRRAERAVRRDDSALALALIGELEEHYPRSNLLEERRAVELLAYCVAGASDAVARAQRFLREHPRSVYAGRIAEKCADSGELSPAGR